MKERFFGKILHGCIIKSYFPFSHTSPVITGSLVVINYILVYTRIFLLKSSPFPPTKTNARYLIFWSSKITIIFIFQKTIEFYPGRLGIESRSFSIGIISEVFPGTQACHKGVRTGWKIKKIDGRRYNINLLDQKIFGNASYTITFSIPPSDLRKVSISGHFSSYSENGKNFQSVDIQSNNSSFLSTGSNNTSSTFLSRSSTYTFNWIYSAEDRHIVHRMYYFTWKIKIF